MKILTTGGFHASYQSVFNASEHCIEDFVCISTSLSNYRVESQLIKIMYKQCLVARNYYRDVMLLSKNALKCPYALWGVDDLLERNENAPAILHDSELYLLSYSASKFFLSPVLMMSLEVVTFDTRENFTRFFVKHNRTKS